MKDLKIHIAEPQARMKIQADKQGIEKSFSPSLNLQPFRQTSCSLQRQTKLSARYHDPYLILEQVGPVVYKLQLPSDCKIHNVFHVSLLKSKLKS